MAGLGDIYISSNFELSSQRPLDSRLTATDIAYRNAIDLVKRYNGMKVYVESTGINYQLILGTVDANLANNANWVDLTAILGATNISTFINDANYTSTGDNISVFTNDSGYIITETDPTVSATVKAITASQVINWDLAFSWGNHAIAGYLTSFTESDPTVPNHVKSISTGDISNWDTAFGWGDHSGLYSLLSHTHANLTTGNGISGSTYDGSTAREFSIDYAGSGGDYGTSQQISRSDHSHALDSDNFKFTSYGTFGLVGATANECVSLKYGNTNWDIISLEIKATYSGGLYIGDDQLLGTITSTSYYPLVNTTGTVRVTRQSDGLKYTITVLVNTTGQIRSHLENVTVTALDGHITYHRQKF